MSVKRGRSTGRSRADWHGPRYAHPAASASGQWSWVLFSSFALAVFTGVLIIAGITATGHTIDMALMHFMLFYAGVFALIGLTAAVGVGLLASDRIAMAPSGRIVAQAVHRAVSFGAVGFLLIHIVTEIIAGRSQAADAVLPFLDHGRTLYLGLGTIASDLFLLILVTGILRARFATVRPTWAWRALHSVAYLAWVMGILHGLLAGRTAKPYVDWSYGACVAAVGLALIVRVVAAGRVRETASSPVPEAPPWLTAGGASPWMPGGTISMLDQAPAPARAVSPRPPLALPAAPPRAIPAQPEPAGQYSERATGPHQYSERATGPRQATGPHRYPGRVTGPQQYPPQATGPHRYPEQVTGPQQYPRQATGPHEYPQQATGPHKYPERAADPQQYPQQATGPHRYPERVTSPQQYPQEATGPHKYPEQVTGPQQYPRQATGPHEYPQRATAAHQYPPWATGTHQYRERAVGPHQYSGPDDPAGYYQETDDEDFDSEWADAEDLDAEGYGSEPHAEGYDFEPHAEGYDFEPHAGDFHAGWADAGDYGPGPAPYPGRAYPPGGTSHLGWTR